MVGPWIHALWKRGRRLSDIEYLSIKEFGGKLRQANGTLSGLGDLATLTATAGKDMYVARARISMNTNLNQRGTFTVQLKANGVVVGQAGIQSVITSGIGSYGSMYEFAASGIKVAATQIIKLEVTTAQIAGGPKVFGELVVFEEDTGASPAIS